MNFRSSKLLARANGAPCQNPECGRDDGTTVAAHSNRLADGKGKGIKAEDFRVAYLCDVCHDVVDGRRRKDMTREQRQELWETAHRATVGYWFRNGIVKV